MPFLPGRGSASFLSFKKLSASVPASSTLEEEGAGNQSAIFGDRSISPE
jgi:hypothetical protein